MINVDIIKARRATREEYPFLLAFLRNFSRSAKLMRASLASFSAQASLLHESMRGYIVAMASCLETFYRDLYLYSLETDSQLLARSIGDFRDKYSLAELYGAMVDKVSFAEIAADKAVFQNIGEIDRYLGRLFQPLGYLAALEAYEYKCWIPSRSATSACLRLWSGWRADFAQIFSLRHLLVHDANAACAVSRSEMARLETVAILVPQMTAALIRQRTRQGDEPGAQPIVEGVVLLVEDLIAEDWAVSEDLEPSDG
jgi:hypothetical protein